MRKKERALCAVEILEKKYPVAECSLDYPKPHELLIATRLAAQCTDARVNMVTPELFGTYPTIEELADAEVADIERIVKSCGFYRVKARDIVALCQMLRDEYNSIVPDEMEELLKLPGIGRKTANLILGDVFGKPSIVCDTHCIRITNLLGITTSKNPTIVERELRPLLPPEKSNDFCHRLVMFGREICVAGRPKCTICVMVDICKGSKLKK